MKVPSTILALLLTVSHHPAALAETSVLKGSFEQPVASSNQYVSKYYLIDEPGELLMRVELAGAVAKPGIYQIPVKTPLLTAIAAAGGLVKEAELESVVIKRRNGPDSKVYEVDLEMAMSQAAYAGPTLEANDHVWVPVKEPLISPEVSSLLTISTSILSLIISAYTISNFSKK